MISKAFVKKVKKSFALAKHDVDRLRQNTDEWVRFLDAERKEHEAQIARQDARIKELEAILLKTI